MGQYALLAVLAVMTIGAVVLYNAQKTAQAADDDLTSYHDDRFGREVALVGLKRTERLLSENFNDWNLKTSDNDAAQSTYGTGGAAVTYTKDNLTGTYQVTYDQYTAKTPTTPALAYVTSIGYHNGERFTIKAIYEQGETDIGVPPSMRESIVSDNELYLNGSISVSGSVHTNDCLNTKGGAFVVDGTGTYTGCETADDGNFTGGLTQQDSIYVDPVSIPTTYTHQTPIGKAVSLGAQTTRLPVDAISAAITGGGPAFPAASGKGTSNDPYILVVRGSLSIDGDVRFIRGYDASGKPLQGHVRIYVDGSIDVKGNSVISPVTGTLPRQKDEIATNIAWRDTNMPDGGSIGIYATGDIVLNGNVTLLAHLYANGQVQYKGGGEKMVMGGITTKQNIEVKGNSQIVYTDPNGSILDPGGDDQTPDGVRLAAYREWAGR